MRLFVCVPRWEAWSRCISARSSSHHHLFQATVSRACTHRRMVRSGSNFSTSVDFLTELSNHHGAQMAPNTTSTLRQKREYMHLPNILESQSKLSTGEKLIQA